ncbi:fungal-specific transcription factor domain-containing protein, partial [Hysterangium stoloniferum]
FPAIPLMFSLFEHYFRAVNIFLPIIHRPSFEADVRDDRHILDPAFGAVVLLVCAIGSRWSDDQEVLSKAYELTARNSADGTDWTSAGWDYYLQTYEVYRKDCLQPTTLCDLQRMALGSVYMHSSTNASFSWQLSGLGVRMAVEVGAHRRLRTVSSPEARKAMWKRVFWVLVVLDRINSANSGRPCAIWDEDIDVDLPCSVDDEYLTPEANFTQPTDQPSRISYFISIIKLTEILAYALKTLYSIRKSKTVYPTMGPTWEQDVIVGLDSSLNRWVDSVPEHLRWDPARQTDEIVFYQSAALYITYHHVQILVHRRYIMPRLKKWGSTPTFTLPSLTICTNAARSCSRIFRALLERNSLMVPELNFFAYSTAAILLYNIWGSNRSRPVGETGIKTDWEQKMEDVKTCLAFIDLSVERCECNC